MRSAGEWGGHEYHSYSDNESIPLINGRSEDGAVPWRGKTEPVHDERCAGQESDSELSFEDLTEEPAAGIPFSIRKKL